MFFPDRLSIGIQSKLPALLQTEAAECGLACLAMISGYHGYHVDLATLRSRFPVSLKGTALSRVIEVAHRFDLGTRALKLDLDQLGQLSMPCNLPLGVQPLRCIEGSNCQTSSNL